MRHGSAASAGRWVRRKAAAAALAAAALWAWAGPAAAHGVGGRTDLPIPAWQLAWAASFAVAASFVALGMFWETPRLRAAAAGRALPDPLQRAGRALVLIARVGGLFALVVVLYAALAGNTNPSVNIAPVALYIVFWVGLQVVSVVIGDVWRGLNPFTTAADASAGGWARLRGRPVSESGRGAGNQWWAVAAVFGFVWLELAYHDNSEPRVLGAYLAAYTVAMLAGAAVFGRGWVRDAEGFGVLFTKLSAIAPLHRDDDGAWRMRAPLAGLATKRIVAQARLESICWSVCPRLAVLSLEWLTPVQ